MKPSALNKRVLILNGSPHRDGATAAMLNALTEALPSDMTVDTFAVYEQQPQPCDDCGACRVQPYCVKHDLDALFEQLEQADILVVAAPVYNLSFPAPMKALIDRFQMYYNRRFVHGMRPPVEKPKKAILLTASGSDDPTGGKMMEQQLLPPFTVMNTMLIGSVHATGTDTGGALPVERVTALAKQL